MSALGSLVVKLALEYAEYTKGLDKSSQDALKFAQNTQRHFDKANAATHEFFTGVVKGAASAAVAYLGVSSAVSAFNDSIDNLASLDDMAQKTGATVENLSRLQKVAIMTGTEFGNVDSSITKLAKNMAGIDDESNKTFKALEALGVSSVDAAGKLRDPAEVLIDVARGLQKYEDGAGKVAIANDLFGKSGAELLPYLNDVNESVDDFVGVSTEAAKKASEMQDRFGALKVTTNEIKTDFAMAFLPAINNISKAFIDTYKEAGKLEAVIVGFGGVGSFLFTDEYDTDKQKLEALNEKLNDLVTDEKLRAASFGLDGSLKRLLFGGHSFEELPKAIAYTRYEIEQLQAKIKNDAAPPVKLGETQAEKEVREAAEKAKTAAKELRAKELEAASLLREQESQTKQRAKFVDGLAKEAAMLSMTAAEAKEYEAAQLGITSKQLEKVKALTKSIETHKANEKAVADDFKASQEYSAQNLEFANSLDRSVDALESQVEAQRDYNDRIGLSQVAIRDLNSAEVERQAVAKEGMASLMDQIDWTGKLGDKYREEARLLREFNSLKNEGENKQEGLDQINRSLREQSDSWASIDRTAHDTFISIANGGKDTATRLRDTFKNMFFDWLYQMTVKKWFINITAGLTGVGASGMASASTGEAGKSLWDSFSAAAGASGMAGTIGTGIAGLGNMIGSSSLSAFGSGMGLSGAAASQAAGAYSAAGMAGTGTAISAGSSVAAAMPYVAAAMAVFQASKAVNGEYRIGGLSADMGALLGFAPRLLGMADKQMGGQTVTGALGTQDLMRNQAWSQKGGLFRSDRAGTWSYGLKDSTAIQDGKSYVDSASLSSDKALLNGLNAGYAAIKSASSEFAKTLGLNAESIAQRTDRLNLTLGKTQEETNAAIQKAFAGVADDLASSIAPGISQFSKEGESAGQTLARLGSGLVEVNQQMKAMGFEQFAQSLDGAQSAQKLVEIAGGLNNLQLAASYFTENFLSDAERLTPVAAQLHQRMTELGYGSVTTETGFKHLVQGLDLTNNSQASLYVELLKLAPAFKAVADSAVSSVNALDTARTQVDESKRNFQGALRAVGDALDGLSQKALSAKLAEQAAQEKISAAYFTAQDAVVAAQERIIDLTRQSADSMKTFSGNLRGFIASISGSVGGLSYSALKTNLTATANAAKNGDVKAQGELTGMTQKFLDASEKQSSSASAYSRDAAWARNLLGSVADAVDGKVRAMNLPTVADPLTVANKELLDAQERLLNVSQIAAASGASVDRSMLLVAGSTSALLAEFQKAHADNVKAQADFATAKAMSAQFAIPDMGSLNGFLSLMTELSAAKSAIVKAESDLSAAIVTSAKTTEVSSLDFAKSLGLSTESAGILSKAMGDAHLSTAGYKALMVSTGLGAMDLATGLLQSGVASTDMAVILAKAGTDGERFADRLRLAGIDTTQFAANLKLNGLKSDSLALIFDTSKSAADTLASSLGLTSTASQTLAGWLGVSSLSAQEIEKKFANAGISITALNGLLTGTGFSARDFFGLLSIAGGSATSLNSLLDTTGVSGAGVAQLLTTLSGASSTAASFADLLKLTGGDTVTAAQLASNIKNSHGSLQDFMAILAGTKTTATDFNDFLDVTGVSAAAILAVLGTSDTGLQGIAIAAGVSLGSFASTAKAAKTSIAGLDAILTNSGLNASSFDGLKQLTGATSAELSGYLNLAAMSGKDLSKVIDSSKQSLSSLSVALFGDAGLSGAASTLAAELLKQNVKAQTLIDSANESSLVATNLNHFGTSLGLAKDASDYVTQLLNSFKLPTVGSAMGGVKSLNQQLVEDWYQSNPNAIKTTDLQGIAYWVQEIEKSGVLAAKTAFSNAVAKTTNTIALPINDFSVPDLTPLPPPAMASQSNDALLAEIRALRAETAALKSEVIGLRAEQKVGDQANVQASKSTTQFLQRMSNGKELKFAQGEQK